MPFKIYISRTGLSFYPLTRVWVLKKKKGVQV